MELSKYGLHDMKISTVSFFLQDLKLMDKLLNKHGENLEEKSLTICSGTDYINVNYQHVVCPDAATAKVSSRFFFFAINIRNKMSNM